MTTVRTTLTKFLKFLKGLEDGTINSMVYDKIVHTLKLSLDRNVFGHMQHEGNVFEIPTKTDLEILIMQGGRSHKPTQPREAHYSKEYLRKKKVLGLPAHEYMLGGWSNTQVYKQGGRVIMKTPPGTRTGNFAGGARDYLTFHESKKSVLKYAFLSAWQDIIDDIIQTYADEVR